MCTLGRRILILACALHFTAPPLCAQSKLFFSPSALPGETQLIPEQEYEKDVSLPLPSRAAPAQPAKVKKYRSFLGYIDKKVYDDTMPIKEERRISRQQWQEFLGVDIFRPYFQAKEIENKICDKTKVEIFHIKGRLNVEGKNKVRYTFKIKF
ncbi:MAG TPA: hypothetical protein VMD52_08145 [Patescibacteria group bacterium]|nr:hypothetical protein [Patescibacteria group bacterium]